MKKTLVTLIAAAFAMTSIAFAEENTAGNSNSPDTATQKTVVKKSKRKKSPGAAAHGHHGKKGKHGAGKSNGDANEASATGSEAAPGEHH